MRIAVRATGWLCIAAGVLVGLYLVYALYWTGLTTSRAQESLLQSFELEVGTLQPLTADDAIVAGAGAQVEPGPALAVDGEAIAAMEFFRPGANGPVVLDSPLMVVEGVTEEALTTGPGRYPSTAQPGEDGNFAVAGHRTTYGAPFWNLDQLQDGDEIHVTDRNGTRWVYAFAETRIVAPSDVSVLAPDPLGTGSPMLTLTTCHPRWSQSERMIVFAELVASQPAATALGDV